MFEQSLAATLARLKELGVRTYIVADVPVYSKLMLSIVNAVKRNEDPAGLGLTTSAYRAHRQPWDAVFAHFVHDGYAIVLDPTELLCAGGKCAVVAGGRSLYLDDHHLTISGALMLKPLFAPAFLAAR